MSDTPLSVQDVAEMVKASMSEMEGSTYERRDGEPVDSLLKIREIFTIPFQMDSQITIIRRDLPSVNWSIEPTSEYTIEMSLPDDMVDEAVDFIEQYMIDNDMAIYAKDPSTTDGIVYLVIEQEALWHLVPVFTDAFIAFAREFI